jgi:hypothetical protein
MRESVIEVYPEGSFAEPSKHDKKLIEELFSGVINSDEIKKFYDKHNYAVLYNDDGDDYMIFKESHPLFNLLVIRLGISGSRYTNRNSIYNDSVSDTTLDSIRKFNDEMRPIVRELLKYFKENI